MNENSPIEPQFGTAPEKRERNWLPMMLAATLVVALAVVGLVVGNRKGRPTAAGSTAPDAYAKSLVISGVAMSESSNLAGGKVTYLDGHIVNQGDNTVAGITVQVLFKSYTNQTAENEILPLRVIRMREPYIDTETVAAAPLAPGAGADFRLIFDSVSPDWNGAYPDVRVMQVAVK